MERLTLVGKYWNTVSHTINLKTLENLSEMRLDGWNITIRVTIHEQSRSKR